MPNNLFIVVAVLAGAVLLLNAVSARARSVWLCDPLLALVIGFVAGPHVLGWVRLENFGEPMRVLEDAARFTLAIGLMGIALRLPSFYWARNRNWLVTILLAGMFMMWFISSALVHWFWEVGFWTSLMAGAIVTPTDPVVSTPIVTGSIAEKNLPDQVRYNISAESGANDGLAFIFATLPIMMLTHPIPAKGWSEWATQSLLHEQGMGIAIGAMLGFLAARAFKFVEQREWMESSAHGGFRIALSLTALAVIRLLNANAILGVFVTGAVFSYMFSASAKKRNRNRNRK